MATAYGHDVVEAHSTGKKYVYKLPYIPLRGELRDGAGIWMDFVHTSSDATVVRTLLNDRIEEGESWPFEKPLCEEAFRNYFFAHTALVARTDEGEIIGAFYCKPNFPGRCSHFCNGGFLTHPDHRRRGVAQFMVVTYLRVAKDLGFRASLFNLVFASNVASVKLWEKLGFTRLATLPKVATLNSGETDAYQYYYDLDSLDAYKLSDLIVNGAHQCVESVREVAEKKPPGPSLGERIQWALPFAITTFASFVLGRVSAFRKHDVL